MHSHARLLAALFALLAFALHARAAAQAPVLLEVEVHGAALLSSPQVERFGPGAGGSLALHLPFDRGLSATVRASGELFSDVSAPVDATLADPGVGSVVGAWLGLRIRPEGWLGEDDGTRARGLYLELAAGAALTGALVRPALGAALGHAFEIDDVRLGPELRVAHLLHFDDPLDASDAVWGSVGVSLVLLDERRAEPDAPAPTAPRGHDRDHDGLLDGEDACPDEPEDHDGFEDEDGCPELDDDRDGILDHLDACPREPETVNGVDDLDGCPDEGLIELRADRIVIDEHVLFDTNRARVKTRARPVLEAVVELVAQHPEWTRIEIEGHADVRGEDDWNLELSERRAHRVRAALVEMGIAEGRIVVSARGETMPRDPGHSEAAHQRNRRVELVVVTAPGAQAPSAAEQEPRGRESLASLEGAER